MKTYLRLIRFVRPYLGIMFTAFACMLISAVLTNAAPAVLGSSLVDRILSDQEIVFDFQGNAPPALRGSIEGLVARLNALPKLIFLRNLIWCFLVAYLAKNVFIFFQAYLMNKVSQSVIRDLRNSIYGKLMGLSLSFFSRHRVGTLVSRITYDTTVIQNVFSEGLTDLVFRSFQLVVCLGMLVFIKLKAGIPWILIIIPLFFLPSIVYPLIKIGRRLRQISTQSQQKMADINTILYESISGIRVAQAFTREDSEIERFRNNLSQYFRIMMKSIKRVILVSPLSEIVGMSCAAVVLWFGGKMVIEKALTPGDFTLFLAALLSALHPISRLSRIHTLNQQALAAAVRVFEILDTPEEIKEPPGAVILPPFREKISFRNVHFKYDKDSILKGIELTIKKGEVAALVGPSGVGKSTLANLILRFYDPSEGQVEIDGYDLKRVSLSSLRGQIGLVTQETVLFNDTVQVNIAYGKRDASRAEIIEAARIANAHEFIVRLPDGYQTVIGDRGFRLSGGEKQRLAIARAILKNPPILILDEATSQMDAVSEHLVQEAIERLMKNRTVLVIAHRLSTIRRSSRILVLEQGRIVASGTHGALFAESELYRKICQMQLDQ